MALGRVFAVTVSDAPLVGLTSGLVKGYIIEAAERAGAEKKSQLALRNVCPRRGTSTFCESPAGAAGGLRCCDRTSAISPQLTLNQLEVFG
jgi:hypothetical protein